MKKYLMAIMVFALSEIASAEIVLHSECFKQTEANIRQQRHKIAYQVIEFAKRMGSRRPDFQPYSITVEACEVGFWPRQRKDEQYSGFLIKVIMVD